MSFLMEIVSTLTVYLRFLWLSPKSLLNSISILRVYCMNTQKRRDPTDPCDP